MGSRAEATAGVRSGEPGGLYGGLENSLVVKQIRPRDLRLALLVGLTAALFIWVVLVYFVEP